MKGVGVEITSRSALKYPLKTVCMEETVKYAAFDMGM